MSDTTTLKGGKGKKKGPEEDPSNKDIMGELSTIVAAIGGIQGQVGGVSGQLNILQAGFEAHKAETKTNVDNVNVQIK